ncbi:hypothetical protein FSP39_012783 [Pinctada imbricata]|uniref:Inositol polyphosphate 1-phosphatase n=1 Tax=Pinctada imbricata TaxID=66713 RepID=A0AA88YXA1_PINIB|nr:hypothetical protein FSP39_012783 [Pinctada imbricata]
MKISELVQELVNSAERGASIARAIRAESELLDLLVQEKKGEQKNPRFVQDFKTLADVLVQEMMKYELSKRFPGIGENIYGEESNKFTNILGETVTVQIFPDHRQTAELLCKVLDGNEKAAKLLTSELYRDIVIDPGPELQMLGDLQVDVNDIGVWIDPIDSTAQYIDGLDGAVSDSVMVQNGLQCVVVLVGVYLKSSGLPIMGVANRPFTRLENSQWQGESMWGVSFNQTRVFSIQTHEKEAGKVAKETNNDVKKLSVLMSQSELQIIQELFGRYMGIRHAAGAGYKLLGVIQGHCDAYVLSKGSTFKWDTCGPHAILLALGGGIISFKFLEDAFSKIADSSMKYQLKYNAPDNESLTGGAKWSNSQGLVAYRSLAELKQVIDIYQTTPTN